ncbi:MAG: GIY-YIG nuclease family protein, partial [Deltaproteobacteria bacterium]|nr:GIY-YIG nuclease family protein [Deltaproteobacteria bacterium]
MNKIEKILKKLPDSPGVYIMRGKEGGILYIGKAKSLRKRVRQYFRASGDDRAFIPLLDAMLGDIEVVITAR